MGYTFKIGNAVPRHSKDEFPYLSAEWEVEDATHTDAPTFPGDGMTGNSNSRSPSYSVWSNFCRHAGIYGLFYDHRENLIGGHPGCKGITADDLELVALALNRCRANATLPPGFEDDWNYKGPENYDSHLARLIWLEWWMRWAIDNCETPAIQNT